MTVPILKHKISIFLMLGLLMSSSCSKKSEVLKKELDSTPPISGHDTEGQTVGMFLNTLESYDAYTLFSPIGSTSTYLIDNCGQKIHEWTTNYRPGQSVYLLKNGLLLRTGNSGNSTFNAGGKGGIIQMIDWESNVVWEYEISSSTACQHHDIQYLPNGNILAIVWDSYTPTEVQLAGGNFSAGDLWSEKIIEIQPQLNSNGATIVWEWKVWDHLIQEMDPAAKNFGVVKDAPERINLNFRPNGAQGNDWLHINSIDYNADRDQILLSVHNFSEIWVIDHSTTTTEAATDSGGLSKKGGDLLYRWGNPEAYEHGGPNNQKLFSQHDANWIDNTYKDGGMIMVFNNQAASDYSTVNVIAPPVNGNGYTYSNTGFGPSLFQWTYTAENPIDFYAKNISGAKRLPNGNTLICEGPSATFFEVDYEGKVVWKYVNPVGGNGITTQFSQPNGTLVFRAEKYARDFEAFTGRTLTAQGYLEPGSTFSCD